MWVLCPKTVLCWHGGYGRIHRKGSCKWLGPPSVRIMHVNSCLVPTGAKTLQYYRGLGPNCAITLNLHSGSPMLSPTPTIGTPTIPPNLSKWDNAPTSKKNGATIDWLVGRHASPRYKSWQLLIDWSAAIPDVFIKHIQLLVKWLTVRWPTISNGATLDWLVGCTPAHDIANKNCRFIDCRGPAHSIKWGHVWLVVWQS